MSLKTYFKAKYWLLTLVLIALNAAAALANPGDGPWNPPKHLYKILWVDTISGRSIRTDSYFLSPAVATNGVLVLADGYGGTQNHGVQLIGTYTTRDAACAAARSHHANAVAACGCRDTRVITPAGSGDNKFVAWWKKQDNTTKTGLIAGVVVVLIVVLNAIGTTLPIGAKMVEAATTKVGNRDYAQSVEKDNFEAGTNKCNLFVHDCLKEAGLKPPSRHPRMEWWGKYPIAAGTWGDPGVDIEGWIVVAEPMPGDIVAQKNESATASGHVGIYAGNNMTISAGANAIEMNDWGFRPGQTRPIFRRYVGNP